MNKVFKTVWNASLGVWVAVSETASSQKKGSNKLKKAAANAVATVVVGAAAAASTGAMAYTNGNGTTVGNGAIAIGSADGSATARGNNTTALGTSATASGQGATAIGTTSNANGQNSTAVGQGSQAGNGSTALGGLAKATALNSTAVGTKAEAKGNNSIALGTKDEAIIAEGENSIAIGASANGVNAIALGGTATGDKAISVGGTATGNNAIGIGGTATSNNAIGIGGAASKVGAVIVGKGSVSGQNSASVGNNNTISSDNTFILGTGITTSMTNSVLLGANSELSLVYTEDVVAKANYTYEDAKGNKVEVKDEDISKRFKFAGMTADGSAGAVSVGAVGAERQIQNVGAGRITELSTDAVNGSQLYYVLSEAQQALYDANQPITFVNLDAEGKPVSSTNVKLGDTFNLQGANITTDAEGNHTLTVAGGSGWNLKAKEPNAAATDPSKTTQIQGDQNTVEFVGSKNAVVNQKELTNAAGDVIGTQLNVEVADQIDLTNAGGLTIAGGKQNTLLDKDGNALATYLAGEINLQQGDVSFGGNQIHNVAAGTALTDVVNVSQLKGALDTLGGGAAINPDGSITGPKYIVGSAGNSFTTVGDAINKLNEGFKLTSSNATGAVDKTIQVDDKIDITVTDENDNLVATQTGHKIEFALANQIALTGDTAGLTIGAGSNGANPIVIQQGTVNFGGNKLQNIAAGTAPTDAVNVSQLLDTVNQSSWGLANAVQLDANGDVVPDVDGKTPLKVTATINGNDQVEHKAGPSNNVTVGTTVQKVPLTDANGQPVLDANGQPVLVDKATVTVDLADQIDLTGKGGLTIAAGESFEFDKDGNKVVQVDSNGNPVLDAAGNPIYVTQNYPNAITINQGNVSFGGNQIHNVAAGTALTDAVNVSQLKGTADSVANIIGGGVTNGPNNTLTGPFTVNGTDYATIADAIKAAGSDTVTVVDAGKNITVTQDTDANGNPSYTVATKDEVDFEKVTVGDVIINAKTDDITGLSNTKIGDEAAPDFATVGRAATEEQLDKAITGLGDILGGGLINNNGQITGPFVVNGTGYDTVADAIKNEAEVAAEAAKIKVTEGKNITVTASTDPDTGKITGYEVKTNDEVDFEKVTVGDVVISAESNDITGLSNKGIGDDAGDTFATKGRGATEEQLNGTADSVAKILGGGVTNNNGSVEGPFVVNNNDYNNVADAIKGEAAAAKTEVEAGKNITITSSVGDNGQNIYTVETTDKASFTEVKFGDTVTINEDGIDAGGTQIINVAAGTENHHAVNLGQMNTAITNLEQSFNTRINDVEDRMSAGIASAMALETAPYVPGKYTYAAATAYHNGQSALGVTLRKTADNGRWSITGGVAAGTEGDPSVRLGVSGIID